MPLKKSVERQIIYNYVRSSLHPDNCNEYLFLIIDQNREIKEKEMKLFEFFKPIVEEYNGLEGCVAGTGLRYKLIRFDSDKILEFDYLKKKVSQKVERDRRLCVREDLDGLEKYVVGLFEG